MTSTEPTKAELVKAAKRRVSPRGSKQKGDKYERELAAYLSQELGVDVSRAILSGGGRTFCGAGGSDLTGLPGCWPEAKRVESFRAHEAMEQAERGKAASCCPDTPVVFSRRNNQTTEDSLVVMRAKDWIKLYRAWAQGRGYPVK